MWMRFVSAILGCVVSLFLASPTGVAGEPSVLPDLSYRERASEMKDGDRCRLDLYLPEKGANFPVLVWLHGGGLTGGSKSTDTGRQAARRLAEGGMAVAMVEYRFNPSVSFPAYVDDVAAAIAWVRANIAQHGGNPQRVVLGGHSAGAYLALMVALDEQYLRAHGLDARALVGLVALSGQTSTHFTVREERRLGARLVVDDAAPLFHVGRRPFPFLLLTAGEDLPLRVEENRLLAAALREAGSAVEERVFEGRSHGTIFSRIGTKDDAVAAMIIRFVQNAGPQAEAP
jgi:acetyl esterase/lipase